MIKTRLLFLLVIVVGALFFTGALYGRAQAGAAFLPFGGRITFVSPCTTPPGFLITVVGISGPRSVVVMTPGTLIFLFGAFHPGAWALGTHAPSPTVCFVGPLPAGAGFPAAIIGTSP
ncbi:MAG: hypothetical protein HYW89_02550 [Candidatus Sungiibacteriota bacterium]|uniref:Uncharacterized protein n=1 Tax=Candidatus Sungiibacteriota bacterium TaxID=2750080 RepID=A0A7T5RIP2_9BACT|nr:MAG: hypothetical protein HYW89_02550 [Candidatus Sungbacteria bacterium]